MNRNKTAAIILAVIVIILLIYIVISKSKTSPVEDPQTELQSDNKDAAIENKELGNNVKTQDTSKKVNSTVPTDWKVFSGHGVSISAPSNFKVSIDSERDGEVMFSIDSPVFGGISIIKASNKSNYDESSSIPTDSNITLTNDNYFIDGASAKIYTMKDPSLGVGASLILIPSKLSFVMVTPEAKSWSGYSEFDVNKMLQSIKL